MATPTDDSYSAASGATVYAGRSGGLPAWVPAPGEVATLTISNGGLTNNFRDVCAAYFVPFYFIKTSGTYGGVTKNPFYGAYGCAQFFSGGHANTNDNTVTIAEYGQTAVTFKRVVDPTPWFGTATDIDTRYNNGGDLAGPQAYLDWIGDPNTTGYLNYGETANLTGGLAVHNGKPASSHTYGAGVFIGPEHGGAAHGTFMLPFLPACNRANTQGAISCHTISYAATDTSSAVQTWARHTNTRYSPGGVTGTAGLYAAFVGTQNRVYFQTNGDSGIKKMRWYDVAAGDWITGTGEGFDFDIGSGSSYHSGRLFYVPERELLVMAWCDSTASNAITIQWADVSVSQPVLGGTVTLNKTLTAAAQWGSICWCPHNSRIIVAGAGESGAADYTAAYEIEIPATLSSTWTATRADFGASQTLPAITNEREFNRFDYDLNLRAIFYFPHANESTDDTAYVYRPRNT